MRVEDFEALVRGDTLEITNEAARDLAIIKQGLNERPGRNDKEAILETIRRIKLLQLDSINAVDRSHYLVLLSRIGTYSKADLDALLFPDKALFEQRSHEACLIPIEHYPYFNPEVMSRRDQQVSSTRLRQLGENPEAVFSKVMEKIRADGPASSKDFIDERKSKRKGWWDRKPERVALGILWRRGYLAVERRNNFQGCYDLAERVIPARLLEGGYSLEDFRRWAVTNAIDAQGIATASDINDYYRQNIRETRKILDKLEVEGVILKVKVNGWKEDAYALPADIGTAKRLMSERPQNGRAVLLSPFDNLIWFRERTERMFDFHFRVEMYTPREERTFGYYAMPILYNGKLIGRVDPKIVRKEGILTINGISFERNIRPDEELFKSLKSALTELMEFGGCRSMKLGNKIPKELKTFLRRDGSVGRGNKDGESKELQRHARQRLKR